MIHRMAACNFVFVVFLALKNTPLAFLTAYSYERLNGLHQIAGYTAFLQAFMHGVIYLVYFINAGRSEVIHEDIVLAAYPLMAALILTVLAATILRRFNYESFYVVHVVLFLVIVVCLGLHRPQINPERILICTLIMAALWVSDRLLRAGRLVYNSVNNAATVYPLPNGGTRIVFKKSLSRARPGKHCYVWLPQIRAFETHPFTIASTNPLELVSNFLCLKLTSLIALLRKECLSSLLLRPMSSETAVAHVLHTPKARVLTWCIVGHQHVQWFHERPSQLRQCKARSNPQGFSRGSVRHQPRPDEL